MVLVEGGGGVRGALLGAVHSTKKHKWGGRGLRVGSEGH